MTAVRALFSPIGTFKPIMARLRAGTPTDLFGLPNGVNEFDLIYDGSQYVIAYTDQGTEEVRIRHAATIAGLESASVDAVISGKYPGIAFDGSTWHVWCQQPGTFNLYHYTAASLTGTWTLAATFGAGRSDPQARQDPVTGLWYLAYLNTVPAFSDWRVGLYQSSSPDGPWTDLGLTFDTVGHIWDREYDPCPAFYGGSAYLTCTVTDGGSFQGCLMAELDRASAMQAKSQGLIVETPNGGPVFVDDGTQRVYYYTASGFGYTQAI